jgi:hypothetical protein
MRFLCKGDRVELANGDPNFSPGTVEYADEVGARVQWDSGR